MERCLTNSSSVEGDTSSFECAHQLGKLCENRHLLVNLIPYNQTDVKDKLRCPSEEHMREFQRIVASYKTFCTIRRTMGADIASACGQLVVQREKENRKLVDVENVVGDKEVGSDNAEKNTTDHARASPSNDLDHLIEPLIVATSIAAICFVASTALFLTKKRR